MNASPSLTLSSGMRAQGSSVTPTLYRLTASAIAEKESFAASELDDGRHVQQEQAFRLIHE